MWTDTAPQLIGVEEARRRLPELLQRAQAGETSLISRHGRPVAALGPLGGRITTDPMLRQRHLQRLLNLRGSGKGCWGARAEPRVLAASASDSASDSGSGSTPTKGARSGDLHPIHRLQRGAAIALDGSALVAFLTDAKGTGDFVEPLLRGIAEGLWRGVLSSLSLAEVLAGPLGRGEEALAQRYGVILTDPDCWTVVPADAELVEAAVRLQISEPVLPLAAAIELATAIAAGTALLVSDNPLLTQTVQHPVLSGL